MTGVQTCALPILKYKEIIKRAKPKEEPKQYVLTAPKKPSIPAQDHPWRGYPQSYAYQQKEKVAQKEKKLLLVH